MFAVSYYEFKVKQELSSSLILMGITISTISKINKLTKKSILEIKAKSNNIKDKPE